MIGSVLIGREVAERGIRDGNEKASKIAAIEEEHAKAVRELAATKAIAIEAAEKLKDRPITDCQKAKFAAILKAAKVDPPKGVPVLVVEGDAEAYRFALKILSALEKGGYSKEERPEIRHVRRNPAIATPEVEILIRTYLPRVLPLSPNEPAQAQVLKDAFDAIGVTAEIKNDSSEIPDWYLSVLVHGKP